MDELKKLYENKTDEELMAAVYLGNSHYEDDAIEAAKALLRERDIPIPARRTETVPYFADKAKELLDPGYALFGKRKTHVDLYQNSENLDALEYLYRVLKTVYDAGADIVDYNQAIIDAGKDVLSHELDIENPTYKDSIELVEQLRKVFMAARPRYSWSWIIAIVIILSGAYLLGVADSKKSKAWDITGIAVIISGCWLIVKALMFQNKEE